MRRRTSSGLGYMDWLTFCLFITMVGTGWFMIRSVGGGEFNSWSGFLATPAGKQLIWIGISGFAFFLVFKVNGRFWQVAAFPIYLASVLLLVAVLIFGAEIKGARSWFSFGGVSFQPSEIAKFGTALALAYYLAQFKVRFRDLSSAATAFGLMLVPALLILLQPDAGSALVFSSFLILFYRAGLSPWLYLAGFLGVAALLSGLMVEELPWAFAGIFSLGLLSLAWLFPKKTAPIVIASLAAGAGIYGILNDWLLVALGGWTLLLLTGVIVLFKHNRHEAGGLVTLAVLLSCGLAFLSRFAFDQVLQPHQQDRINVWLHPEKSNPQGSLYNLIQSKTAIGSGGMLGKGYRQGTMTKLKHVPEQSTDFIFCTVGEEQGFVGSAFVILVFLALLLRILYLAERQNNLFATYYAYGIAGILFLHFFVNIGMTLGLVPIIGIPLPFLSKGGSSLLGFTIMIAVLLKLDSKRFQFK